MLFKLLHKQTQLLSEEVQRLVVWYKFLTAPTSSCPTELWSVIPRGTSFDDAKTSSLASLCFAVWPLTYFCSRRASNATLPSTNKENLEDEEDMWQHCHLSGANLKSLSFALTPLQSGTPCCPTHMPSWYVLVYLADSLSLAPNISTRPAPRLLPSLVPPRSTLKFVSCMNVTFEETVSYVCGLDEHMIKK